MCWFARMCVDGAGVLRCRECVASLSLHHTCVRACSRRCTGGRSRRCCARALCFVRARRTRPLSGASSCQAQNAAASCALGAAMAAGCSCCSRVLALQPRVQLRRTQSCFIFSMVFVAAARHLCRARCPPRPAGRMARWAAVAALEACAFAFPAVAVAVLGFAPTLLSRAHSPWVELGTVSDAHAQLVCMALLFSRRRGQSEAAASFSRTCAPWPLAPGRRGMMPWAVLRQSGVQQQHGW